MNSIKKINWKGLVPIILPILILAVSLTTHFLFFGQPKSVVFDEVYNGSFLNSYANRTFYFDIHPPLAKLIIKSVGDISGVSYGDDYGFIGKVLPDQVIFLRLFPLIAGILLPLIVYYIARLLGLGRISSLFAGLLICLENSLLIQSRFILFDSILVLFGMVSVMLYLMYTKNREKTHLIAFSAFFSAFAFSIKWTGLAFPLLIFFFEFINIFRGKEKISSFIKKLFVYAIVGILVYISAFAVHFSILNHSDPKYDPFVSDRFQKTLIGSNYYNDQSIKPKGFFGKFMEINIVMYEANKRLETVTHPYSSPWYSWPIMLQPIFYWLGGPSGAHSYIYLIGNIPIYWLGILAMAILLIFILELGHRIQNVSEEKRDPALFIAIAFFANFLPFALIGRVMFLYHYETALVFSIIALAFLIDLIKNKKIKITIILLILAVSMWFFIYFSPFTYGLPLTDEGLNARMWFETWR